MSLYTFTARHRFSCLGVFAKMSFTYFKLGRWFRLRHVSPSCCCCCCCCGRSRAALSKSNGSRRLQILRILHCSSPIRGASKVMACAVKGCCSSPTCSPTPICSNPFLVAPAHVIDRRVMPHLHFSDCKCLATAPILDQT